MLGKAFHEVWTKQFNCEFSDIDTNEDWLKFCDFRDYNSYRESVINFKPDLLIHLGAYTNLEFCENNVDDSYLTNTISVEHAVSISNELEIPILYISTAGIYDGSQKTYDDWSKPNPLGVYARTKYLGERHVVEYAKEYMIFRAGWMMGGGPRKDKKFIGKLMNQIIDGKRTLQIVDDKMGTPTYTLDFANNALKVFKSGKRGLFNLVCGGFTSRLEVAQELITILNNKTDLNLSIEKVSSDYFQKEYFAPRPDSEQLLNYRLNLHQLNIMRDWRECLSEYIEEWINEIK